MKYLLLLCITLLNLVTSTAQFGPQQVISTAVVVPRAVFAADLDGDGDADVLSASEGDDTVAWYENTDGQGSFGSQQIITQSLNAAIDVYAADLDGDGDMDILVASKGHSQQDGRVVWFENTDGLGTFGVQQDISTLTDGAISVFAADFDGDGDLDVLSASFNDNKVAWYENTDGLGTFGPQQIITTSALSTRDAYAADLDGDGDMDVLAVSTASDEVLWFENTDGLGNFGTAQVITANTNGVLSVFATDLDGDGDQDVLSASPSDDKLAWYENTDGLGAFGPEQIITTSMIAPQSIYTADVDNDGDMDVLSTFLTTNPDGGIVWYENLDGLGAFGPPQIINTDLMGPRGVYASDLDNDGDLDVLSVSSTDHKIAWYENFTILGVDALQAPEVSLYPNPVDQVIDIKLQNNNQIKSISLFDALGRQIFKKEGAINELNISQLPSGVFFLQIQTNEGIAVKKVIKE